MSGRLSECRADCQRALETVRQSGRLSDSQADCQRIPTHTKTLLLLLLTHILYPHTSIAPTYFTLPLHPHQPHCTLIYFTHPHSLHCTHILYLEPVCMWMWMCVCVCVCVCMCVCVYDPDLPTVTASRPICVCVYPSSIPKWAPVRPIRGPFGAHLCPTGAQLGPTWNAAWVCWMGGCG